ncbi:MAG: LuxR family transcriptional regulator [Actinobacteria bacterium]|nr:MAG: LuxR family transcriptional regulator [Actinomycetota bacterium]
MGNVRLAAGSTVVGRDRELAMLHDVLAATANGTGGCAVLTGAPGIGKTRLLADVSEHARALGLAVAPSRAIELDRAAPLRSLLSAVGAAGPRPVDLAPLRDNPGDRLWYAERLGDALEAYVAEQPLVIVLDDAHWCDELSALALRVLVPRLASSPLRWMLARRPVPADSPAQDAIDWLVSEDTAAELRLGPLDDDAVQALCANVLGAAPDATVLALAAAGKGNPFLLEQYLSALKDTGQILIGDGVASVVGGDLPESFLSAVDQRLRGLSAQTRRLLQAGSVFGRPFSLHAAALLVGQPATTLVPAAEEAVSAGILLDQDAVLAFAHDLWRQAVYDNLAGTTRTTLHREAASVVRAEGCAPVEIAEHLVRSGQRGDREAVQVLRQAAEDVAARAPGTAADLALHALGMLPADDPQRNALGARAVGLLASAGRVAQARELGEATLRADADGHTRATVLLGLAEALKHAGQNRTAAEYAQRALADPAVPDVIRAHLHAVEAHALLYVDDLAGADRAGTDADRLGTETGEPAATAFGNSARSVVARAQGRLDDALACAGKAVSVSDAAGGTALHRHPRIWYGAALAAVERFAEAEAAYEAGRHKAEELGSGWAQPLMHYYHSCALFAQGRLDEAAADAEAGVRIAEQLTALQLCVPLLGLLARIATVRAQLPVAHEHLRRMNRLRADGITAAPEDVAWSIAVVQFADGQAAPALATLAELFGWLPDRLLLLSNDPGAGAELVRIALAAADTTRARSAAAAAGVLAGRNPAVATFAGVAAQAEGLARRDPAALRRAVDLLRDCPRPLVRISAFEDAAKAEKEAGQRRRAIELLEQAIAEANRCGARRPAERMARRLRVLGVQTGTRPEPAGGGGGGSALSGLTAAERTIGLLVAEGMTNQQIATRIGRSPHTVDSHLRNIFQKLGVNSRVAVARVILSENRPNGVA